MTSTLFYYKDYWVRVEASLNYEDRLGNIFTWSILDPTTQEIVASCSTEPDQTTRYAENVARAYIDHFLIDPEDWVINEAPWKKAKLF